MMNPLPLVIAESRKNPVSVLGILVLLAIAFSGTVAVSLFERGLRSAAVADSRDADLVVGAAGSQTSLVLASVFLQMDEVLPLVSPEDLELLARDPRVAAVSPLVFSDHWGDWPIIGVGADLPRLRPGMKLVSGRWPSADFEVLAGAGTTLQLGDSFHGSHGFAPRAGVPEESHQSHAYTVVGRLALQNSPWDRAAFTPYSSIWRLHEDQHALEAATGTVDEPPAARGVSAVLVKPKGFAQAYQLKADWSRGLTTAAFPAEVLGKLFGLMADVRTAFSFLSLGFQALVFVAVLISLLAGLPARLRWIGMLRALGAGKAYIFLVLWLQSALVFLLAGVMGLVFGWLAASGLGSWIAGKTALAIPISPGGEEILTLAVFWLAGMAGALIPALAGFRTSVRKALISQA